MLSTKAMFQFSRAVSMGVLLTCATATHANDELGMAQEMFSEHRYAAGLIHLRKAADAGDRSARQTLGLMLFHGQALYGPEVPTERELGLRWLRLAAADGCEISQYVLSFSGPVQKSQLH